MPILWLAPGDDQQPHRPVCGLHTAEDWQAARRIPRQSPRPRQAGHDTEGAMGDDDPKFGPLAMCSFWAFALVTSAALVVVAVRTVARLAVLVGLL